MHFRRRNVQAMRHLKFAIAVLLLAMISRAQNPSPSAPPPSLPQRKPIANNPAATSPIRFVYQPIDFELDSCETPERHAPETMAGGVALFDSNNDGNLDSSSPKGRNLKTPK